MIKLYEQGGYLIDNELYVDSNQLLQKVNEKRIQTNDALLNETQLQMELAKKGTMSYSILESHNTSSSMNQLEIKFDAMASHDITYVGIVQTARASGLESFPIPYVLTNCHNSLCAVGGTINEDDHVFGLSAAKKYGGIYVPAHQAVIHSYMREAFGGCNKMILGSDSHTRYGALGTMAIGEGGPELVKQLLKKTYDVAYPDIVGIQLTGKPMIGVGPQDVALSLIGEVFANGFVKNSILEFFGSGISDLSMDYRFGIDVMTTETTCLSSVWITDEKVNDYLTLHGRMNEYAKMAPQSIAYYDKIITIELDKIKPMIALPFHPSNVYSIDDLNANPFEILKSIEVNAKQSFGESIEFNLTDKIIDGKIMVDQGIIAGCSGGTYENINICAQMIKQHSPGNSNFVYTVYPGSQPIFYALTKDDSIATLMEAGAIIKTAFCGPCFGAGDVPSNNSLSIRHTTRNFPSREGSKPGDGQIASVALMDARSITATAINKGILTPANEIMTEDISAVAYEYNPRIYKNRIYNGFNQPDNTVELKYGPNIKDWPEMITMTKDLLLEVVTVIHDDVTTTDELIPSGETSSYRSNPLLLAEFALSRKDPNYVPKAKAIHIFEKERVNHLKDSSAPLSEELKALMKMTNSAIEDAIINTSIGSIIYANKPGDGSAREQAASVQKVLGGWGNIATDYATKRYRSNLINWGLLPFITEDKELDIQIGDYIYVKDILALMESDEEAIDVTIFRGTTSTEHTFKFPQLSIKERDVLKSGCLMNFYRDNK
jgi:aconitate hydratase